MSVKLIALFALLINYGYSVPPRVPESLQSELEVIKSSIKQLAAQMEKLNHLYLNTLEPKIAMTATTLAGIDSNVRSLQERSHVWDTFQLYIASWNEQMSTSDRKLDIISSGQEKLFSLDSKINALTGLAIDEKFDKVLKKLSTLEETKRCNECPRDTLFSEFATRGILSTVKSIERKLDKTEVANVSCNCEQEILSDVSAKVDVIFDKISNKDGITQDSEEDIDEESTTEVAKKTPCNILSRVLNEVVVKINSSLSKSDEIIDNQNVIKNNTNILKQQFNEQNVYLKNLECHQQQFDVNIAKTCDEIPVNKNGIYQTLFCEFRNSSLWTVIQRRGNYDTHTNFNVSWDAYKNGFGDVKEDYWAGNYYLNSITVAMPLMLRIELEDFDGNFAWAEYDYFTIGSEMENFVLTIAGYKGNASDALSSHNGSKFSTFDRTNDEAPDCCPCANSYGGGWWFNSCFEANLNGIYFDHPYSTENYKGIIWETWLGNYSLKASKMMVRRKVPEVATVPSVKYKDDDIPFYEDP